MWGRRRHPSYQDAVLLALVMSLLLQAQQAHVHVRAPVTLALVAGQVAIYLRKFLPLGLARLIPSVDAGCLHPASIVRYGQWSRLLWGGLLHLSEAHIYWNMASLLSKGVQLERRMGSVRFAGLVVELMLLESSLLTLGCWLASRVAHEYRHLMDYRAAGFSGVLFAMKVMLTHNNPGTSYVLDQVPVPTKYLAWAELILIHIMVPDSSFAGHLAGIIAGLIHVQAAKLLRSIAGREGLHAARQRSWFQALTAPLLRHKRSWGHGRLGRGPGGSAAGGGGAAPTTRSRHARGTHVGASGPGADGRAQQQEREGADARGAEPAPPPGGKSWGGGKLGGHGGADGAMGGEGPSEADARLAQEELRRLRLQRFAKK